MARAALSPPVTSSSSRTRPARAICPITSRTRSAIRSSFRSSSASAPYLSPSRESGGLFRRDQPLRFEQRVDAAGCHQRQQLFRYRQDRQQGAALAAAHGPALDRNFRGVALLECGVNAAAFECHKAEADRISEEQAVDRLGDERAEPEIAQRACRWP